MVSAFIAQYYPPGELEYTRLPLVIPPEGAHFNQWLDSYAASIASGRPDMGVLDSLLKALSRGLVLYFSTHEVPNTIVIIPHRILHIIPWHMVQLNTKAGLLYLPSCVRTILARYRTGISRLGCTMAVNKSSREKRSVTPLKSGPNALPPVWHATQPVF